MIIFIPTIICIIILYIYISSTRKQLIIAEQNFSNICCVTRLFTDIEKIEFLKKFRKVYTKSRIISLFFIITRYDRELYLNFTKHYKEIERLQKESNNIYTAIEYVNNCISEAYKHYNNYITKTNSHYFSNSEAHHFIENEKVILDKIKLLNDSGHLQNIRIENETKARILFNFYSNPESSRLENNIRYKAKHLVKYQEFFDTILKYPLDFQQRESIVTLEDNCLVVSSAGSGKTSTLIGKIMYLINVCKIKPEEILTITYTRKSAQDLCNRINIEGLQCVTFHKLALDIITEMTGEKPSIAAPKLSINIFYELLRDEKYQGSCLKYLEECQTSTKDIFDYNTAAEYYADRKKYGIQALYTDKDNNVIFTHSFEENKICNILTHLGIKFNYEKPYPIRTLNDQYRQYLPDFTIFYEDENGNERILYYEHYAIDKNNQVPKWFGDGIEGGWEAANRRYLQGIKWKEQLHKMNNTRLIFTRSADFHSGNIENEILRQLNLYHVPINQLSDSQLYQKVVSRNKKLERSILDMCNSFISLMRANDKSIEELLNKATKENSKRNQFIIQNLIIPFYTKYENRKRERGEIDFIDAILSATKLCMKKTYHKYKYILVDEFQDISMDRYKFLLSLRNKKPLTKFFCVGDDWQSIYRFSGSDMTLFSDFSTYFGYTEECKIETTYRFGNPLINVSSNFIQQNPVQKKKTIKPKMILNPCLENSNITKPNRLGKKSLLLYYINKIRNKTEISLNYTNDNLFEESNTNGTYQLNNIEKVPVYVPKNKTEITFKGYTHIFNSFSNPYVYSFINNIVSNISQNDTILILGRYTLDAETLNIDGKVKYDSNKEKISVRFSNRTVPYLTIHSSKGLEADYVFILNCNGGDFGFPSKIADDEILNYVLSDKDTFEYGEERRLFYVGITRAKKHTYVLYDERNPSIFITELNKIDNDGNFEVCPICKVGHKIVKRTGIARNGNEYIIWGCSNRAAGCPYFKREFKKTIKN